MTSYEIKPITLKRVLELIDQIELLNPEESRMGYGMLSYLKGLSADIREDLDALGIVEDLRLAHTIIT